MSDSLYSLYINDVMALARSLIVKSSNTISAINKELQLLGYTVDPDPKTWKYYLNLAGEYHEYDTPMSVISIDTLETIEFTKANLAIHRATAAAYTFRSRYYNELLARYPLQESLLRGILDPVDLDTTIAAAPHTILQYDESLVEVNEETLIAELQVWIQDWFLVWNNVGYLETDDLFAAAQLGVLWANLPNTILNIRLNTCHTRMAHSYHVWTYLRSKGRLDRYRRSLSAEQALFLYRNIRYILQNTGKTETFELLVEHLLTRTEISLYGFRLRHNLESLPDSIEPNVDALRFAINKTSIGLGLKEVFSIEDIAYKTRDQALLNSTDVPTLVDTVVNTTRRISGSSLETKVLESLVVGDRNISSITLNQILMEEWAYLAANDIYTANLRIINPVDGKSLQVNPITGYLLYVYARNVTLGVSLTNIPTIATRGILRKITPSLTELLTRTASALPVTEIQTILDTLPLPVKIINTSTFRDYCTAVFNVWVALTNLKIFEPHLHVAAQIEELLHGLQDTIALDLTTHSTFQNYFKANEINVSGLDAAEGKALMTAITTAATGIGESLEITSDALQSDLIDITDELTSYNIQFVKTVIGSNSFYTDIGKIKTGQLFKSGANYDSLLVGTKVLTDTGVIPKLEVLGGRRSAHITARNHMADHRTLPSAVTIRALTVPNAVELLGVSKFNFNEI